MKNYRKINKNWSKIDQSSKNPYLYYPFAKTNFRSKLISTNSIKLIEINFEIQEKSTTIPKKSRNYQTEFPISYQDILKSTLISSRGGVLEGEIQKYFQQSIFFSWTQKFGEKYSQHFCHFDLYNQQISREPKGKIGFQSFGACVNLVSIIERTKKSLKN